MKHKKNKAVNSLEILEKTLGPITFAMFMRVSRTSMDLTQADMARKLKMASGTVCDIEKGRQLVSVSLAARIAKVAGLCVPQAIEAALQDQLRKAKLNFVVKVA